MSKETKIMIDGSPNKIVHLTEKHNYAFWQLRTPLTRNRIAGVPYGLDNGCYTQFQATVWRAMLEEAENSLPIFVALPDVVGNARRTRELFDIFELETNGLPRAMVLQDGIGDVGIPWQKIECVFIGGTDRFKCSQECRDAVKAAKILDKWVHVGRVNSPDRLLAWHGIADSIDGSGISRFDHMLDAMMATAKFTENQMNLGLDEYQV